MAGSRKSKKPVPSRAAIDAQAAATKARPLHVLPATWRDPEVAENMADWIEKNVPVTDRRAFIYGGAR